jgi:SMI1 / KNR4 family (SUKH-1)
MNSHVKRFYQQTNESSEFEHLFYEVIYLEKGTKLTFDKLKEMSPNLPRGWFELSQLNSKDRIEFTLDFWLKILPFQPHFHRFLENFFQHIDDVGIYLTKDNPNSHFQPEFVYSIEKDKCFFRGFPPASSDLIAEVKGVFSNRLPNDFFKFNLIHNGFKKHLDSGIFFLQNMRKFTNEFQQMLLNNEKMVTCKNKHIDPTSLIPFYECFGLNSYQCFYFDWYPKNEIGNVYFSGIDYTISDYLKKGDSMAFASFVDWLIFYLEPVEG